MDWRPLDLNPPVPDSDRSVARLAHGDLSSLGGTGRPGWDGPPWLGLAALGGTFTRVGRRSQGGTASPPALLKHLRPPDAPSPTPPLSTEPP